MDLLDFDRANPRYTPDKHPENSTDEAIIIWLDRTADLGELVQSMAHNGYISIEPMIVYANGDRLTVLEGNRRLAALKVLRSPDLAAQCKVAVPEVPEDVRSSFESVLVYRVEDKNGARELIGFKHINGSRPWDAYAKALYAMRWLDAEKEKPDGISLQEIAQRMGDKHDTLHRMVTAAYLVRQAQESEIYDVDDRKTRHFSFSHLYTALAYPEYTNYLGMRRSGRGEDPSAAPVPQDKLPALKQLMVWLYGSKNEDKDPVIETQAKDLGRLKQVLAAPAATRELEERGNLNDAVVTATPRRALFAHNLIDAAASLKNALEVVTGYDPVEQPDLMEIGQLCVERSEAIEAVMHTRIRKAARTS